MNADGIKGILSVYRFDTVCEAALQGQIEKILQDNNIEYEREVRLSPRDRIDFVVQGIGIEVKIKGSAKAIYRQCQRYCADDRIKELFLVSGRSMGLPETIEGKPCYYHNLGRSWL